MHVAGSGLEGVPKCLHDVEGGEEGGARLLGLVAGEPRVAGLGLGRGELGAPLGVLLQQRAVDLLQGLAHPHHQLEALLLRHRAARLAGRVQELSVAEGQGGGVQEVEGAHRCILQRLHLHPLAVRLAALLQLDRGRWIIHAGDRRCQ